MSIVTYHHVKDVNHPVIALTFGKIGIPRVLMNIAEDLDLLDFPATNAVVAYCDGRIVGMFRYLIKSSQRKLVDPNVPGRHSWGRPVRTRPASIKLVARGTCVHPSFRKQGIASRLWSLALNYVKPDRVVVFTGSEAGYSLARSLAKQHIHICWNID